MILNLSAVPGVVKPRFIGSHGFTGTSFIVRVGRKNAGGPVQEKTDGNAGKGDEEEEEEDDEEV